MVHVKSFFGQHRLLDSQVANWLNNLPQPLEITVHRADGVIIVIGRERAGEFIAGPQGIQGATGLTGATGPPGLGFAQSFTMKSAAQQVMSSVVLVNDLDLMLVAGAGQTWVFELLLVFEGAANADIKFSLTGPAGALATWGTIPQQVAGGGLEKTEAHVLGETQLAACDGAWIKQIRTIKGLAATVGAGTFRLQWAQNAAQVVPTIMHPPSYWLATRVGG